MRPLPEAENRVAGAISVVAPRAMADSLARISLVPQYWTRNGVHFPKTGRYIAQQAHKLGASRTMPNPFPQVASAQLVQLPTQANQNGQAPIIEGGVTTLILRP